MVTNDVQSIANHLISTLQEALKAVGGDSVEGKVAAGKIYESAGLLQLAVECYESAARGGSLTALARLAICQLKAGNLDAGLDAAVKLSSSDRFFKVEFLATSEQVSALTILGDALLLAGRDGSAVAAYKAALQASPDESYAAGRLAHLLLAHGDVDGATQLESVIGTNPRFGNVRALLHLAAAVRGVIPDVRIEQVRDLARIAMPGRPLLVCGDARVAASAPGPQWLTDVPVSGDGMTAAEREIVGAAWEEAGRVEHASVAAFARFILQLMSLGAPAELVSEASRALQDEIEHARLSLGVASGLLGRAVGVGSLDLSGVIADESPAAILRNTILEGCVGETIAARQALEAASRAEPSVIRGILSRIAQDEARHAELAWRFVAWMLSTRPELVPVAREAFDVAAEPDQVAGSLHEGALSRHGQLSESAKWDVTCRVLRGEIRPRADSLLHAPTEQRPRVTATRALAASPVL